MKIELCATPKSFPGEVGELRDCNALLDDRDALVARMAEDGYLLIRGFHPRELVLQARERIMAELSAGERQGHKPRMKELARLPEIMRVIESPHLFAFFQAYFGEAALTFDYKWLRAVQPGEYTGIHYDVVYMGRGSGRLHTVWTPFDDIPVELGTLAICAGSHREAFARLQRTYGRMDVDRDNIKGGGWYSHDPDEVTAKFGGSWQTTNFTAGDIILFTMFTLHCSTRNLTTRPRLSCDTRFQPASDVADDRWYGAQATGHTLLGNESDDAPTIDQAKKAWGV